MRRVALKHRVYGLKRTLQFRRNAKMQTAYDGPDGRKAFVRIALYRAPFCQIHEKCSRDKSVDIHEKIPRSAGGAIVPGEKATEQGQIFFAVCRADHDYIHDHPKWAKENGWLI